MKKYSIFINTFLIISILYFIFLFAMNCFTATLTFENYNIAERSGEPYANDLYTSAVSYMVQAIIEGALIIINGFSLFFFNYRFDGVSMREKIAARLVESKEKRAQYRAKKTEEDKQKRLEKLQAEMNELKKD